jgi:putative ABC transport system permease protein
MIRIAAENEEKTFAGVSTLYKEARGKAMSYSFMGDDSQSFYESEKRVSRLAQYFGVVAIFLSCLGLFGLAAFTAKKRKKEIGVRKVMGATVTGILTLVSKDFLQLILISIVLAEPIGWYLADSWLAGYAYQANLSWWIFAGSDVLLILISLFTVGYQAYKAANANPVHRLKSE